MLSVWIGECHRVPVSPRGKSPPSAVREVNSKMTEPELDVAILSRLAAMPESSAAIPLSRVAAVPELGMERGRQVYRQKYRRETIPAASGK